MRAQIRAAIADLVPPGTAIEVVPADHEDMGDYSTRVAFTLSKVLGRPPVAIAEDIAAALKKKHPDLVRDAVAATPGFLNITLTDAALQSVVTEVLEKGSGYGPNKLPEAEREHIQVEYISANPTGPLTLANGRGGFLGDVISNALMAVGHMVEREYYVNDTGNQIETLGKSILAAAGKIPPEETFYKGDYVRIWAEAHLKDVERLASDPHELGRTAARDFLTVMKSVVEGKAGILFDRYTSEYDDIRAKGYPEKALALFRMKGVAYEADGTVWLKTTDFGDDKDRVLVMKTGEPTYFLADAGHYIETVERGFTWKINILGPDHYGYVARIQAAAKLVELQKSEVLITQAVRLIENGVERKMSKRSGTFVAFNELVEEVLPDAARFFFLSVAPESHMDFDLTLAKERSNKNPVFYAQYAYVRAVKVLERFGGEPNQTTPLTPLTGAKDRRLMRLIADYPAAVEDTARDYRVHRLTQYASALAKGLHDWYETEHVVGEAPDVARARAALLAAVKITFENLFSVIGITAPSEM
ncbi:MAG: arginine--tRNA ligase [bacterium]|nr:arginine--tRNA ligase [bacterium]